ncbi:hypothetical protein [Xanthomonas campestris]|uniref:hypothetical protein n=1 Tax=Xanthomonas campestris TaxID=339 RepID=UPI0015F25502|nr:hypothetical protein [Xanthomonas campestris]MEB2182912.1 hypothetical protein [Xanthomonas campestris pv. campestris]MEA9655703.1 hypothetical protein [Xanthomonas campestris pv. raphani]MEA9659482.1 hypothetical protein [Xanthomonas campestris pv. raphani]MEA9754227.1 hypothetical protein [Xanthomonas campestris pv. raphani]MEA9760089.1 hypothetical protein [Xanthomonas campestris pv. raphani]
MVLPVIRWCSRRYSALQKRLATKTQNGSSNAAHACQPQWRRVAGSALPSARSDTRNASGTIASAPTQLQLVASLPAAMGRAWRQAWPSRQGSAKATTNTTKKRSSACALPSTSRWSRNSTNSSSGSTIDKTSV